MCDHLGAVTDDIYDHLTYGVEVGPARMLKEDESRLVHPAPGIAAVVISRADGLVIVSMEGETDDDASRATATDFVRELMDYLSLGVGVYEAPAINLAWGAEPGRSGRTLYMRAQAAGVSTATATLTRDPDQDARFVQAAPARIRTAQGSWVGLLLARLRESSEIGGCGGFIILYDAIKEAAAAATDGGRGERNADAWMHELLPSIAMSQDPRRPPGPWRPSSLASALR